MDPKGCTRKPCCTDPHQNTSIGYYPNHTSLVTKRGIAGLALSQQWLMYGVQWMLEPYVDGSVWRTARHRFGRRFLRGQGPGETQPVVNKCGR